VYRRYGTNPVVLPNRDDAYGYVGRAFKIVVLLVAGMVVLNAFTPRLIVTLGPILWLQGASVTIAGWVLLAASLLLLVVAQAQMGRSWRIGIDENTSTDLIRTGLFAHSRNPIFLAMRVNLFGLLLVLPNAMTLALFVAGDVLMQVQVRLEEAHLLQLHTTLYQDYCAAVRRWV
jgi:protein-S-isoprenylcysteine O-methyltransferase Ste14